MIASLEAQSAPASVAPDAESALIVAWRDRADQAAAREIVARLLPLVCGVARRCLPRPWMVDDAVQNTLANVFHSLDIFDQRVPLSAWAVCLAKNVCADFLRAWQRRTIFSSAELGLDHLHDLDRGSHLPSLDDAIVAREEVRHVLQRVAALDETDRLVASLVLIGGSSARSAPA